MPEVLRERIPEVQANWIVFTQAIKGVNMGHIREGVRKYKEKAAHDAKVNTDINFLKQHTANATVGSLNSPTKAIRTQLAGTTISQQTTSYPAQQDLFGGIGGGRGNLFNTCPPRLPATEAEKTTIRATLALYPMKPETPEGEAAYLDQLRAWRQLNGNNHISKTTGFPLHPGGAPPGSGECYNCGQAGHRRTDCQITAAKKIPQLKATFCAICRSILWQSRCTVQINYVATSRDDKFAWVNANQTGQQGNGEGLPAIQMTRRWPKNKRV